MWYYAKGSEHVGPLSEEELSALIRGGEVTAATLVWKEDMSNWARLSEVPSLLELIPKRPPPLPASRPVSAVVAPPTSTAVSQLQELPLASPWLRFFARSLDVWVATIVIIVVGGVILAIYFPSAFLAVTGANESAIGLIFLPITLLMLALCSAVFGNTIGKALFGIKVRNLSQHGSLRFFLRRELQVWVTAFALGIPLIALFTQGFQYRKVAAGQPASYDVGRGRVEARPISVIRKLLGVLMLVALVGGFVSLIVYSEEQDRRDLASFSWRNPVTQRSTLFPGVWHPADIEAKGGDLFYFAADSLLAEALFGHEKLRESGIDPQAYATALQQAISKDFTVTTDWLPVTVRQRAALRANGTSRTDANVAFQVTVTIDGTDAWRTLVFTRGRKVDETPLGKAFVEAAFSSI
ncbi:RDD family protein [Mesorhizobium sp. M0019]|uniref:RDD family protein n=1 Tax=Mesorhizobium sp. M0019 TaxID=2956845 RepID=UPI003339B542